MSKNYRYKWHLICNYCHKGFRAFRPHIEFCSQGCRQKACRAAKRWETSEYHDLTIACVLCGTQMGVATMTEDESEQLMEVVYTCRKCEDEFQAGMKDIEAKLGGGE